MKITATQLRRLILKEVGMPKAPKSGRKLTVTLDLDALAASAKEIAEAGDGTLESSGGTTVSDLERAWEEMSSIFDGVNKQFARAVDEALTELSNAESSGDDEEDSEFGR